MSLVVMTLGGCGSSLPEGRPVYAPAVAATEQTVAAVQPAIAADGVVVPTGVRVLSDRVAVLDVLMITAAESGAGLQGMDQVQAASVSLRWRYAGKAQGIELRAGGERIALRSAFRDEIPAEEMKASGVGTVAPLPRLVVVAPRRTGYSVPIVLHLASGLGADVTSVDVLIGEVRGGLAGLRPYGEWVSVPVVRGGHTTSW